MADDEPEDLERTMARIIGRWNYIEDALRLGVSHLLKGGLAGAGYAPMIVTERISARVLVKWLRLLSRLPENKMICSYVHSCCDVADRLADYWNVIVHGYRGLTAQVGDEKALYLVELASGKGLSIRRHYMTAGELAALHRNFILGSEFCALLNALPVVDKDRLAEIGRPELPDKPTDYDDDWIIAR